MNKIDKVLLDEVKEWKGNVLGFGDLSEKIITSIEKNNNILECTLLSSVGTSSFDGKGRPSKKIPYRKIRKKFRKKCITNIIAFYDELGSYHRRFISDSLFLAQCNITLFIKNENIDIDIIKKRYERYHQDCDIIPCRDGVVFRIRKKNYKRNRIRDTFYLFINFISDGVNFIGDLFVV